MSTEIDERLCKTLHSIYALEISLGNSIASIDTLGYTKCPFAINFKNRLHFEEISKQLELPESVERWENKDSHYSVQAGYFCNKYKHSIAGPLC